MKKIVVNLLAATSGGQLTRARAFLQQCPSHLNSCQLIVLKEPDAFNDVAPTSEITFRSIPVATGRFRAMRRAIWENTQLAKLIRQEQPDAYLTFSHYLPVTPMSVPSVVGVSNLAPFSEEAFAAESFLGKIRMTLLRHTIISSAQRADRVIALSRECRNILSSNGVPKRKIVIASNGVDTRWNDSHTLVSGKSKWGIKRQFILYVSHYYRYKNHLRLIDAYNQLPTSIRATHQLVMVGKPIDERYFRQVASYIEITSQNSEIVQIPGLSQDELRLLYQTTDLFVFPSLIENCPNSLLEAMMAGAPVASAKQSPMPEFAQSAAVYFDARNPADISEKMANILIDGTLRSSLRKRSVQQASKFTWDNFVRSVAIQIEAVCR